jgi:hypothetical protein
METIIDVPEEEASYVIEGSEEHLEEKELPKNFYENLAEVLDKESLNKISETVMQNYEDDKESRSEWEETLERGIDLLGLKIKELTEPFEGACSAIHPLIIENAIKFQSKASQELFPAKGPVRTQIAGDVSQELEEQARRVKKFMNYQLTEQMPEYFDEFERLLFQLPIFGSSFKKVYFDVGLGRNVSEFVSALNFIVPYNATDLRTAQRYTHYLQKTEFEINQDKNSGFYRNANLQESSKSESLTDKVFEAAGISNDSGGAYNLLEQHLYLDIDDEFCGGDHLAPYVVTVDESSGVVLAIRRNWKEGDPNYERRNHFVHYKFIPGFGFYGIGYIHILGNITLGATNAMRSLIDAGQFATIPAGFKRKGVKILGENASAPLAFGEWRDVESTGQDLRSNLFPVPYKEPSATLYEMYKNLVVTGQKFADSTEQVVADSTNYGPVGTTMALMEQSSKFFTAIHKRLHKSQRDEFKILAELNSIEIDFEVAQRFGVSSADFDSRIDVLPVSDPNIPSATHRFALYQFVLQLSSQAPAGTYDITKVHKALLTSADVPDAESFFLEKQEPQPMDPFSDIMAIQKGMPIAAFPGQNHEAHVAFKQTFMQDPTMAQNPQMQQLAPLLAANISEHMLLQYRERMQAMMQPSDDMEFAMAQAAQQMSQMAQMAAQGAQQGSLEDRSLAIQERGQELQEEKLRMTSLEFAATMLLDLKKQGLEEKKFAAEVLLKAGKLESEAVNKQEQRSNDLIIAYIEMLSKLSKDLDTSFPEDNSVVQSFPDIIKKRDGKEVTIDTTKLQPIEQMNSYADGSSVDMALKTLTEGVEGEAEAMLEKAVEISAPPDELMQLPWMQMILSKVLPEGTDIAQLMQVAQGTFTNNQGENIDMTYPVNRVDAQGNVYAPEDPMAEAIDREDYYPDASPEVAESLQNFAQQYAKGGEAEIQPAPERPLLPTELPEEVLPPELPEGYAEALAEVNPEMLKDLMPAPQTPEEYANEDLDTLARIIFSEARGEDTKGKEMVAASVIARQKFGRGLVGGGGGSVLDVVSAKNQYEGYENENYLHPSQKDDKAWLESLEVAKNALTGKMEPMKETVLFYRNDDAKTPGWFQDEIDKGNLIFIRKEGNHSLYRHVDEDITQYPEYVPPTPEKRPEEK